MDQIKVIKDWPGFSSAPYTAVSRKVVGKNVHATSPKGSMGYWSCRTHFNTRKHTLHGLSYRAIRFFQIS